MDSVEYLRAILKAAEQADAVLFARGLTAIDGLTVNITIESGVDEYCSLKVSTAPTDPQIFDSLSDNPDVEIRFAPAALTRILEGRETPVESFFLGYIRAKGKTKDLYQIHTLFIALAEIAIRSSELQDLVQRFQEEKE